MLSSNHPFAGAILVLVLGRGPRDQQKNMTQPAPFIPKKMLQARTKKNDMK